jgi:hypothetical protein
MKKSTNESPEAPAPKPYKVPLLWEMFIMEGGISLLIFFPLVVLFFLKKAYESV